MLPWAWAVEKEPDHPVRMSDARHAGEGVLGWAHTVKQTLKLSNFLGHSANAVRWQVYTALLVYVLLRFQGFLSAWAHSFTRLFAVVRSAVWERLDLLELLKSYGTASGRIRFIGALHEAWQQLWLSGLAPPAGQNTASTA